MAALFEKRKLGSRTGGGKIGAGKRTGTDLRTGHMANHFGKKARGKGRGQDRNNVKFSHHSKKRKDIPGEEREAKGNITRV